MIEDLHMRKQNLKTQNSYLHHVTTFTEFLGYSPYKATWEDFRRHQLHMVDIGRASSNINANLSGLRFFFEVSLNDRDRLKRIKLLHQQRKIPLILSADEMTRLIDSAWNLKSQATLSVAYGARSTVSSMLPVILDRSRHPDRDQIP